MPSLDPAAINARTPSEVVSNLYDNLVQLAPNDMVTLRPMLARQWKVSSDSRSLTFNLRQDATFARGAPVTAEDAAWSIQRVIRMGQVGVHGYRAVGLHARQRGEAGARDRYAIPWPSTCPST